MTNLHRSPPMNQSETDLGIVNESQLLGFGINPSLRRAHSANLRCAIAHRGISQDSIGIPSLVLRTIPERR
jgi:hypothetical protein